MGGLRKHQNFPDYVQRHSSLFDANIFEIQFVSIQSKEKNKRKYTKKIVTSLLLKIRYLR